MNFTIAELARAVGKSENYVRQHVHRKHLPVQKDGRKVSVALDEAARWARERGLPFNMPARGPMTSGVAKNRTARMTVLAWHTPDAQPRNLFTLVRHRRRDALGPWADEPDATWTSYDLGKELRLYSFDAPLEHCQALVDHVLDSSTLEIDGIEVRYVLEPRHRHQRKPLPRYHWAYRYERLLANDSIRSPFSNHSAEVTEYWSFAAEPRQHWRAKLEAFEDEAPPGFARLGFPLHRRPDRIGNLMIASAQDAIACDLELHHDRTLRFHVGADNLLPDTYRATIWASHSRDEVLRQEIPVTAGQTAIEVASDVDHIGFAVYRNANGQCIDLMDAFLMKEIGIRMKTTSGPTLNIQDRRGRLIHEVRPPSRISTIRANLDDAKSELDNGIRRQWLDRQIHKHEAAARREGNLWRFQDEEFDQAVRRFVHLLERDADQKGPVYLADPYFMDYLQGDDGTRLYLDMFAATAGRPLRILCGKHTDEDKPPWLSTYPKHLTSHLRIRAFLKPGGRTPHEFKAGFHDRYLITPRQEIVITHSFSGWSEAGVTFVRLPYGVYRAEAERFWSMDVESPADGLVIREIA